MILSRIGGTQSRLQTDAFKDWMVYVPKGRLIKARHTVPGLR